MAKQINQEWTSASRRTWYTTVDEDSPFPGREQLQTGCLQRIAESLETIARRAGQDFRDKVNAESAVEKLKRKLDRQQKRHEAEVASLMKTIRELTEQKAP